MANHRTGPAHRAAGRPNIDTGAIYLIIMVAVIIGGLVTAIGAIGG